MSFSSIKMPEFGLPDAPSLPESGTAGSVIELVEDKNLIYQWTDSSGNIQFTNVPPPEGVEYTVKGYDPNTNVIQPVKSLTETAAQGDDSETGQKPPQEPDGIASVYSPEKIKKLFDDAENVEKLLNDRLKKQEAMIGD